MTHNNNVSEKCQPYVVDSNAMIIYTVPKNHDVQTLVYTLMVGLCKLNPVDP